MKERCLNKNKWDYKYYGGRGITISDEWLNDFNKFIEDMGDKPEGHTLDRIDTNKGYCKENCKWSTRTQQAQNHGKVHKAKGYSQIGPNTFRVHFKDINGVKYSQCFSSEEEAKALYEEHGIKFNSKEVNNETVN